MAATHFEKQVYADGNITRAEYDEANAQVVRCMHDFGFDTVSEPDGLSGFVHFRTTEEDDPSTTAVEGKDSGTYMTQCQQRVGEILYLYTQLVGNPAKKDLDEIVVECFHRKKLVPESWGVKDYLQVHHRTDVKVGPYDPNDLRISACEANPAGA